MTDETDRPDARTERVDDEELKETVVRNTPWFAISIALHAIVISILFVLYAGSEKPRDEVRISAINSERPQELDTIEPPPEEKFDRSAIPDYDEQIEEKETQVDEPLVTIDKDIAGREDLENTATDDDAIQEGPDSGLPGGTSIGVGEGGHVSLGVSPYAGRPGKGGVQGKGKYKNRTARSGGRPTQKVVMHALEWLASHQDPKGFWSCDGFSKQCDKNRCSGEGDALHGVGVTGLALLAFLGNGHTPEGGEYQEVVKRGILYLHEIQDKETGLFGDNTGSQGFLYDQALASLAMCEAYGLSVSKNPALKKAAQKAVYYCQSARNPYKAWRYACPPDGQNDVSVTGWMVMVLRSAKDFDLSVDDQAFDGAKMFIEEMTDPNTGRTGYISKGGFSAREPGMNERWPENKVEAMTAVAMLCRVFMGEATTSSPALRAGADLLRKSLPVWDEAAGTIDYYYWYYGSYAMYQMGGSDWAAWEPKALDAMVKRQAKEGCEKGSWDPAYDPWGPRGGRVYSTATMCLAAEVYYRYERVIGSRKEKEEEPVPK